MPVSANETRLWTWHGKGIFAGHLLCVVGTYLEAQQKALALMPGLTKEDLDSPWLFDCRSEDMGGE